MRSEVAQIVGLRFRASLLEYHRDSYVVSASAFQDRPGAYPETPGEAEAPAGLPIIDCASGYFRHGTSRAIEAALRTLDPGLISRYPEVGYETLLKPAILERFRAADVTARHLFLGHGSFNLMERVIHKLLRADVMLGVGPQFNEVPSEFEAAGGLYRALPLEEEGCLLPLAALEKGLSDHPVSILYVDNPSNPLGLHHAPADLERLAHACARRGTVLLVDEAWGDYIDDSASAIHMVARHPNIAVVRSFSKALGLAGERVGYMFVSSDLARHYRQIHTPFEPSIVGAVLARAVLDDADVLTEIRREAVRAKERTAAAFEAAGLEVLPTHPAVAIMGVRAPGRNLVLELRRRGIRVLAGSSFGRTNPRWDDSYCRVRTVEADLVEPLCGRLATM